jgi:hypothetical protein
MEETLAGYNQTPVANLRPNKIPEIYYLASGLHWSPTRKVFVWHAILNGVMLRVVYSHQTPFQFKRFPNVGSTFTQQELDSTGTVHILT